MAGGGRGGWGWGWGLGLGHLSRAKQDGRLRQSRIVRRPVAKLHPPRTEAGLSWEWPLYCTTPELRQPTLHGYMAFPPAAGSHLGLPCLCIILPCFAIPAHPAQVPKIQPWPCPALADPHSGRWNSPACLLLPACSGRARLGICGWGGANLELLFQLSPTGWDTRTPYKIWNWAS